jgi:hypothetical protein
VTSIGREAAAFKKMQKAVVPAACTAGELLKDRMTKLIRGESSLSAFRSLADHVEIFKDEGNLVVGIGPTQVGESPNAALWDQYVSVAQQMDQRYQVADVARDLAKQSGEIEAKFLAELAAAGSV